MTSAGASALGRTFRDDPAAAVLFTDFDGTLSPIVDVPADAALLPGAAEVLVGLADRFRDVVVVSGRPLDFLTAHLPSEITAVGLYGLEGRSGGTRWEHPQGGTWREVVGDVAALAANSGPAGVRVESKGLSLTLHYRGRPDLAAEVAQYAAALAERSGLEPRAARMSVELHPPIATDKGTVVERFAAGASAALYAGDDAGDLPAFDALDRLAARGLETARVVVASSEVPSELRRRGDVLLDGPEGVLDLFRGLLND